MASETDSPSDQLTPIPRTRERWLSVWALWSLLTAIGLGVGWLGTWVLRVALLLPEGAGSAWFQDAVVAITWFTPGGHTTHSVVLTALGIGVGQWLLLRRWVRQATWWIPGTVLGQAAGWGVAAAVGLEYRVESFVWIGSGLTQWILLRHWSARAWWWLPAALVVGGSKMLLDWAGYWGLISDVSGWALHATISGAALWAVLRQGDPARTGARLGASADSGRWRCRTLSALCEYGSGRLGRLGWSNTGRGLPGPADPSR